MGDMSGSKSSSSSSTNTTNTTNIDRRQVMSDGAIGITSDSSTVNVQSMDAGLVKAALDVVSGVDASNRDGYSKLLDVVVSTEAAGNEGYSKLLSLTEKLFSASGQILEKTADTSLAAVSAVNSARNDATGTIDQKTLVILGAVGLGAAFLFKKAK